MILKLKFNNYFKNDDKGGMRIYKHLHIKKDICIYICICNTSPPVIGNFHLM